MKTFDRYLLNSYLYCAESINKVKLYFLKRHLKAVGKNFYMAFPYDSICGLKYISIGDNCYIQKNCFLGAFDHWEKDTFNPEIKIGNNFHMNFNCQITAINKIVIGDNVLIGSRVYIMDYLHGKVTKEEINIPPVKRSLFSKGPVIIGNNVWIGSGVIILPNVTIGDNCIIGANSVVTKSFEKNSVIAGNPARLIKTLQ